MTYKKIVIMFEIKISYHTIQLWQKHKYSGFIYVTEGDVIIQVFDDTGYFSYDCDLCIRELLSTFSVLFA